MRSSAGSITKLKNGSYKVTVTVGADPLTGRQQRVSRTVRGSKREAEIVRGRVTVKGWYTCPTNVYNA